MKLPLPSWKKMLGKLGLQVVERQRRTPQRRRNFESLEGRNLMATLYWDTNGSIPGLGGAGAWDTTTANWTIDPTGSSDTQAWNNGAGDEAVFAGTAGTVTLGTNISTNSLAIQTTGYTVTGTNTLTLGGTGEVNVATSVAATLSSVVAGSVEFKKTGSGTLTVTKDNTGLTGGSRIEAGTLQVNHNGALGADTITLAGGKLQSGNGARTLSNALVAATGTTSELVSPTNSNLTLNGNITGDGTIWKTGGYSVFLGGDNSGFSGTFSHRQSNMYFTTATAGSAAARWDITGGGQLGLDFNSSGTIYFGAFSGTTGTLHGGTNRSGAKTVEIGALNTSTSYAGTVIDYQTTNGGSTIALIKKGTGTLMLSGNSSFSAGSRLEAGTLQVNHNSALGTGAITLAGGKLQSGNSHRTLSNAIVAATGTTSELLSPTNSNLTLNGNITGDGTIWKTGAYSVFLGGDNSGFNGTFSHRQSNLYFNNANAGSAAAAWDITGGNNLGLNFATSGTVKFGALGGTTGALNGGANLAGAKTVEIGALNTSTTYSGTIKDFDTTNGGSTVSIVKLGSGTLTLGGNNSFSNGSSLETGTLIIAHNSALGTGTISLAGGKLQAGNAARTLSNNIVAATGTTSELISPTNYNLTLNGNISGSGAINKSGGYSVLLGGDNSAFSGTFSIRQSNAYFNQPESGSALAIWDITGGDVLGFNFAGDGTVYLGALSGTTGRVLSNVTNGQKTVEIGALDESTTYAGTINNHSTTTTATTVSVVKNGSGSLTLAGRNTFTGDLTINNGMLTFSNAVNDGTSKAGRGTITIRNGSTLRIAATNVLGTGSNKPSEVQIQSGGILTTTDNVTVHLPHVTLNNGTISGGAPTYLYGSFNFMNGIDVVGAGDSTIAGENLYISPTSPINIDEGSTLLLAANFGNTPGLGSSQLTYTGAGNVVELNQEYTVTLGPMKGESTGNYNPQPNLQPSVTPVSAKNWIEAVEKSLNGQQIQVNGSTYTISPGGGTKSTNAPGGYKITTVAEARKHSGNSIDPSYLDEQRILVFEDWTDNDYDDKYWLVNLGPTIQIINSDQKPTETLKVAKWQDAFDHVLAPSATLKDKPFDGDPDRFYVRVVDNTKNTDANAKDKITVKISTDSDGSDYDDAANSIELTETGNNTGVFVSGVQILVASKTDDQFSNTDIAADEALNDSTHIIALGGILKAEYGEGANAISDTASVKKMAEVIVKITVAKYYDFEPDPTQPGFPKIENGKIVYKKDANGELIIKSPVTQERVEEDLKLANEQFAQMGIGVKVKGEIRFLDPPANAAEPVKAGLVFGEGYVQFAGLKDPAGEFISSKTVDDIDIFYVGKIPEMAANNSLTGNFLAGATLSRGPEKLEDLPQNFVRVLNTIRISPDADAKSFVFAHELLHALRDDSSRAKQGTETHELSNKEMLMFPTTSGLDYNKVEVGRRVKVEDETLALKSSLVKKVD